MTLSPKETSSQASFVGIDLGVTCVVASSPAEDRYAVTVNTNDVSGRSTPAAVSFDGKLRHVGMAAEGRVMSAPKQTLTHIPLALSGDSAKRRSLRYLWQFPLQEDGQFGPFSYNGEDFTTAPAGPLSALIKRLSAYATGSDEPKELCVAVHDYLTEAEVAVVRDALDIAGLSNKAQILRHSDALAAAFVQSCGLKLFQQEGCEERTVAFVDIGASQGTVAVVRFSKKAAPEGGSPTSPTEGAEAVAEFLYRRTEENLGVQSFVEALLKEAVSRIEQKHKCQVQLRSKAGLRLSNEAVHALKQLSMLPDAEMNLEAFLPQGPDGPEIDVSIPLNRDAFEAAAAATLTQLKQALTEAFAAAPEGSIEGVEVVGGGGRVPAVQALIREVAGEGVLLRFGLDGASCIATGAAAWAAGRRCVPPLDVKAAGLPTDALAAVKQREAAIEATDSAEVHRLEKRNELESYVYQVRDWLNGRDGALLNPAVVNPLLDKVTLWFEDAREADYGGESPPTSLEEYTAKLEETQEQVKKEGAAFFEKKAKEREEQEKALEKAAEEERQRRKELGMDADKDDRHMKKDDRIRLAAKNKDEGNDMFKAQKFDDAIRRYKKAIDHVTRPEVVSNLTPDEAEECRKIKVSCHLNSAMCYIKGAELATSSGGNNAAEPFYKKAKTACDDVLELDDGNIKAMFRRSLCWEKLGELDTAIADIKKGLAVSPEDSDLKKSLERLQKLLQKQKDGQKKVFSKMFG